MSVGLALALPLLLMGPVELRGGVLVEAPVVGVSERGVEVGGDEARTIGWDNVKRVIGEGAEQAEPYMEMSERAWRARIRLARGDYGMASPLLEDLFRRLRGEEGPTALMAAEGALACRLWFGDRVGAVEAWLEAVRLREAGWKIAGDPPLDPIVDPETLLMPALAPVWLESESLVMLAEAWDGGEVEGEGVAGRLRVLYGASARRALGLEVDEAAVMEASGDAVRAHPGVVLVGEMVRATSSDPGVRAAARASLREGIEDDLGTWREAWRRAALGRSLLLEEDEGVRLDGVFELVHLPARFTRSRGYLAGLALAVMSVEARRRGDVGSAERIRSELEERHPGHPGVRWLDERERELAQSGGDEDEPTGPARGRGPEQESERIDDDD